MDNKTIIVKNFIKSKGGYEYVEFCQTTKEYTTGDSSAHEGHGNYLTMIEAQNRKALRDIKNRLISDNYRHIETFR